MAESVGIMTKRDLTVTIKDDTAVTPLELVVNRWPGDFSYEAPLYDTTRILNNGRLDQARKGDDQACTFTFSAYVREWYSATDPTLPDICENRGYWGSTAVAVNAGTSDLKAFTVGVVADGSAFGRADRTAVFANMILRGSGALGQYPSVYNVRGESITAIKPTFA